jgi:hypothetical protein
MYQWPAAVEELAPEWRAACITGTMTAKEKRMFWANIPDIICTNYQYIKSIEKEIGTMYIKGDLICVVCDEGHGLCGYRGSRSKSGKQAARIIKLTRDVPYRYLASASLLDNPDSSRVWGPVHWLDRRILPATIGRFESDFFDNHSRSYKYKTLKLKPSMREELTRRLFSVGRRVTLDDLDVEVPEVIVKDLYVPLPPKTRKAYRQLKNEAVADIDGRELLRGEVLARNMTLLQIASGFAIDHPDPLQVMAAKLSGGDVPEHDIIHIDSSHKDKALESVCGDLSQSDKLIVWAHHTHELEHLERLLKDLRSKVVRVDGVTDGRQKAIASFQSTARHSANTFLGQPGACGAGLNLQVAQHMARWSRSHFITHHNQSMGRNRRAIRDQLFKHLVYHCIMSDATVDVRTEMRNRGKRKFAGEILLEHLSYDERNLR